MVEILYEDKDIIVVEKPYGIASQTERGSTEDMVSLLMNYLHEKSEPPYVGVVHRLDKNVAGIMVYAKNKNSAAVLSRQIADNKIDKRYYAAVYNGDILDDEGKLTDFLIRDGRTNSSKVTDENDKQGKRAELLYRKMSAITDNEKQVTFMDVKLITGRHHQIRVQFSSRGCPLSGDRKYGVLENKDSSYRNVGLYCYSLSFRHPKTGKEMTYTRQPSAGIFKEMTI